MKLETNYRFHPGIIQFYSEWMTHIPGAWEGDDGREYRYSKNIKPQDKEFAEYQPVVKVSSGDDVEAYHREVYDFLKNQKDTGKITDYKQVAFLFRSVTNDKVKDLARFLEQKGIPVYSPRSGQFFDREEVRLMLVALLTIFPKWRDLAALSNKIQLSIWNYYDDCFRFFSKTLKSDLGRHKSLLDLCITNARMYTPLTKNTPRTLSNLFYELL